MNPLIRWLYQALAHAIYLFSAPYFLARMVHSERYRAGIRQRLGLLPRALAEVGRKRPAWIHAVSMGETRSIEPVVEALHRARPELPIVISTVTRTGQSLAARIPHVAATFYLPLELGWIVARVFRRLQPRLLVLVDTELWPALLDRADRRDVPVIVINGRISDRSWPRYRRVRWFTAPLLSRLSRVYAQSALDAERFIALGANAERVSVVGNTKYDAVPVPDAQLRARWRTRLGVGEEELLIVAGSTFPGEEGLILAAAKGLPERLRLVLAPRHPERADEVVEAVKRSGKRPLRLSRVPPPPPLPMGEDSAPPLARGGGGIGLQPDDVLIVDTFGQLREIYAAADLAVVGKSFRQQGGQNPIEPASQGVATLAGPHMENFREVMEFLSGAQGVVQLSDESQLGAALQRLCASPEERAALGRRALAALATRRGASARIVEELLPMLERRPHGADA